MKDQKEASAGNEQYKIGHSIIIRLNRNKNRLSDDLD